MRPSPNFKMSKSAKIYLAATWNRANRAARRRSIIQAELYGAQVTKSKRERDS